MAPILHSLVKDEYQANNFLQYRYYVECSCGFQCRLGTQNAAHSQFDAHLITNKQKPIFVEQNGEVKIDNSPSNTPPNVAGTDSSQAGPRKWAPIFGK